MAGDELGGADGRDQPIPRLTLHTQKMVLGPFRDFLLREDIRKDMSAQVTRRIEHVEPVLLHAQGYSVCAH